MNGEQQPMNGGARIAKVLYDRGVRNEAMAVFHSSITGQATPLPWPWNED